MAQVVTQLIVDARGAEQGSAAYIRAMKAAQAAADATVEREAKLQGAINRTSAVLTAGAGSVSQIERRWNQLVASVDPVAAAHQKAQKAIEDATLRADAAVRRLSVSQDQAGRIVEAVRAKHAALTSEVERAASAANDNSAALARMRAQYDPVFVAQLRHRDALTSIADAERAGAISTDLANDARRRAALVLNEQVAKLERLAQTQKEAAQRQVNQQAIVPNRGADVAAYGVELDRLRARFDPLFAAQQAYRSGLADLRQALAVGAVSEAAYTAELDRRKRAFAEQVQGLGNLSRAQRDAAAAATEAAFAAQEAARKARVQSLVSGQTVAIDRGADIAAYGQELDRLRAKYSPLFVAQTQYRTALAEIGRAARIGAISEAERAAAVARTKGEFVERARSLGLVSRAERDAAAAAHAAGEATSDAAEKVGIASHHMVNLYHQISDVAVSLQGGQSPFTVLLQQGSQIAPILGETGVSGAVRGIGSAIARFITPGVATVGLLTGAVIYGYNAWSRYDDEQRAVGVTLQGLGRNVGLTRSQFDELAASAAKAGNVTVRQASDFGRAYASTGKFDAGNIARLIGISKDAAATFGESLEDVQKRLTEAFGTSSGIERLNDQLQFLDARTRRTIQSLFDQGRAQEAIQLAIEKMPPALVKAEEAQGIIARGWEKIRSAISDADHALGRFLDKGTKPPEGEDRLKILQDRLKAAQDAARNAEADAAASANAQRNRSLVDAMKRPGLGDTNDFRANPVADFRFPEPQRVQASTGAVKEAEVELRKYMESLAKTRRQEEAVAEQKALEQSLIRKSNQIQQIAKEVGAGSDEWLRYRDSKAALDAALASGDPKLMKMVDSMRDLSEAQSILDQVTKSTTNAEGERMTAAERASRQNAIEVASARARTTEEKARVAQMRQEEQQRGQLITTQQAQADAEHAAQMVREEANSQLRSMLLDQQLEADAIQKRIDLLGTDAESRTVATARQRAEQEITRQGISLNSDLAQSVIRGAEANARLGVSYEKMADAQRRSQEATRALGDEFSRFFEDALLSTTSLTDAFASLSRNLSSGALRALLTGEGPMANILGTANPTRGELGGMLGGIMPSGIKEWISEGAEKGAAAGTQGGWANLFGNVSGKQALQGFAGGAMLLGGIQASRQGGLMGMVGGGASSALGGYMLGNMLAPGVGGIAGGILGAVVPFVTRLFGGKSDEQKQRESQRREEYAQARPQIETLRSQLRGETTAGTEYQIREAYQKAAEAARAAQKGGDNLMLEAVWRDFYAFAGRMRATFSRSFEGTLTEVLAGLGTNGPFAQASAAVIQLGESLRGFVADAIGISPEAGNRAGAAAREAALQSLETPRALSEVETEMRRIEGTGAGLVTVLMELALSADQAAAVIQERTARALDTLRTKFTIDLDRKINDAVGNGYLNEVADLLTERQSLLRDATLLGTDTQKVEAYITAAAQKIVDGSELTGDAFTDLVRQFPDLTGRVREFSEAIDETARKAAIASRVLGYQDRLFAATNDTSTLAGQLAAFDRQAQRERKEEIKAGGEAIADLEAAQYAERAKIVQDFAQQAVEAEKQRAEAAQQAFDTWSRSIKQFVDEMRAGSNSPLSPEARLAEARAQYTAQLALAQSGNRDALDGITGSASTLLDAAKAMYASSEGYQAIFDQIAGQLTALPSQVSPEQFIVNAIDASKAATITALQAMQDSLKLAIDAGSASATAAALLPQFNTLTATTNGLLNYQQFIQATGGLATAAEQQAARAIFNSIDADGNGQIDKLELLRANTAATNQAIAGTNSALSTANATLQVQANSLQLLSQISLQNTALYKLNEAILQILNTSHAVHSAIQINTANTGQYTQATDRTVDRAVGGLIPWLADIRWNTGINDAHRNNANGGRFATGGWVEGPGTGTSDSIAAMLSNGEFVVKASQARIYGPLLEAMNDNRFVGMPSVVAPMPMMAGGGSDQAAMLAELRRQNTLLQQQIALLQQSIRVSVAAAEDNREGLDDVKGAVSDAGREQRLLAA